MAGANGAHKKSTGYSARNITKTSARPSGIQANLRSQRPPSAVARSRQVNAVVKELARMEGKVRLVWVPDLVRSMAPRMSTKAVHEALMTAQRKGILELRPESGVGRVPAADLPLMPRNSDGHPLSNVLRYQ